MNTTKIIQQIIESVKRRPPLTDEEIDEIRKQCEKEQREIEDRQKIGWKEANRPMDI